MADRAAAAQARERAAARCELARLGSAASASSRRPPSSASCCPAPGDVRYLKARTGADRRARTAAEAHRSRPTRAPARRGAGADGRRPRPARRPTAPPTADHADRRPRRRRPPTTPPTTADGRRRPRRTTAAHGRQRASGAAGRAPDRAALRPLPAPARRSPRCAPPGSARSRPARSATAPLTQQVEDMTVPARRGTITDRNGLELAVSEDAVTVFANPFLIDEPGAGGGPARAAAGRARGRAAGEAEPTATRASSTCAASSTSTRATRSRSSSIEGIGTVVEPKRTYPQGALAVAGAGRGRHRQQRPVGPRARRTRTRLHGTDGQRRVVKDALGEPVSLVETERAEAGEDLRLTLDAAIQERVEAVLAEVGPDLPARRARRRS